MTDFNQNKDLRQCASAKSECLNKKRIIWVDALRGFLIISVVLGHAFQRGEYNNSIVWNFIYSFHMAAFFTLSGWISYRKEILTLKSFNRRAFSLLWPFFIWSLIKIVINSHPQQYLYQFILVIQHPDKSFWFLYILFIIFTICEVLKLVSVHFSFKYIYLLVGSILIFFGLMIVFDLRLFGFQLVSYYIYFYCLGVLIKKYDIQFNLGVTILLGILWGYLAFFWKMHDVPAPVVIFKEFIPASILSYVYRIITATLGSIFFLNLSRIIFTSHKSHLLSYLGIISLEIYIIHMMLADLSKWCIDKINPQINFTLYCLSDFLIRIILSVVIIAILLKLPIIKRLLFARK